MRAPRAVVLAALLLAAPRLPAFTNYVVDEARAVPDDVEAAVNAALDDYQRRSGNQVAVAVVRTTQNQSIEDYTNDLFNQWGVGKKGDDNGVLLVIAVEDRELRIEVGDGLGADFTDVEAAGVVRDEIVPVLREGGDVGRAVVVGTESIRRALGDELAGPAPIRVEPEPPPEGDGGSGADLIGLLVLGAIGLATFRMARHRTFGRPYRRGGMWYGGGSWGSGWGGGGFGGGGFGGGSFGGGGGGHSSGGGASGSW